MIEQRYVKRLGAMSKPSGKGMIGVTGPGITAGMVMSDQQGRMIESAAEDVRNGNLNGCLASGKGKRSN